MKKLLKWTSIGFTTYILLQIFNNMLKNRGKDFRAPLTPRRIYRGSINLPVDEEALGREYDYDDMDEFIKSVQEDIRNL